MITVPGFYPNGTNASLAQALGADMTSGYTLFVPSNDALAAAGFALASVENNQTALLALLGNHGGLLLLVSHTTQLSTSTAPLNTHPPSLLSLVIHLKLGHKQLLWSLTENASSAKIIRSDVLVNDGVVHVVDRVLVDLDVDSSKAAMAYASATSAASQLPMETGPIGTFPASTSTSASPSASAGSRKKNAARAWAWGVGMALELEL